MDDQRFKPLSDRRPAENGTSPERPPAGCRKVPRWLWRFLATPSLLVSLVYFLTAWFGGCASPIAGLWPPAPGEQSHRIIVSVDRWHSIIGIWPEEDPDGRNLQKLEEWGYAEKGFYLEGDQGSCGTLRAICVPSAGVVQRASHGRPWSERSPQPPAKMWSFRLTEQGYQNLVAFFSREVASPDAIYVGASEWYTATHDYHLFHHCHHWTARALRSAGLPVWSFYGIFKWCLEAQLERATGFCGEDS